MLYSYAMMLQCKNADFYQIDPKKAAPWKLDRKQKKRKDKMMMMKVVPDQPETRPKQADEEEEDAAMHSPETSFSKNSEDKGNGEPLGISPSSSSSTSTTKTLPPLPPAPLFALLDYLHVELSYENAFLNHTLRSLLSQKVGSMISIPRTPRNIFLEVYFLVLMNKISSYFSCRSNNLADPAHADKLLHEAMFSDSIDQKNK